MKSGISRPLGLEEEILQSKVQSTDDPLMMKSHSHSNQPTNNKNGESVRESWSLSLSVRLGVVGGFKIYFTYLPAL